MDIKTVVVGSLDENCYVLKKGDFCLIVDPGDEYEKIKKEIGDNKVLGVLITHSHFDHVGALREFLKKKSVKIFKKSNTKEEEYTIGDFSFTVYNFMGHSSDSIAFYFKEDNAMFVGDFVFKGSVGRCDLPTGDFKMMEQSILKLKKFDPSIVLYPGHGEKTTLQEEIKYNEYF